MIWITRDREFIDYSQQQNRKDFVIGLQKWAPSVQNNKSGGPNLQPCHHDITTAKPRGGGALQLHLYGGVWPQDWKIDPSAD